ncbi:MAG TPA: dihydrofolate reductase family protein [Chitinophagaceae bacterium]|nr:dihydrofolate reductase family protein [Chitinophagaceae bacterium]
MRKIILQLAVSLDGFIEDPNGEFDWCFTDDDYGMTEFFKRIDAIFIGRKSYELTLTMGGSTPPGFPVLKEYVFSKSLNKVEGDRILVSGDLAKEVKKIKNEPGKDIWLYGGAALTSSFINFGLVDEMTLAVHPILLGAGKPLFQNIPDRVPLQLINTQTYPSGLVMLSYKFPE